MSAQLSYRLMMLALMVGYGIATISSIVGFDSIWGVTLILSGWFIARHLMRFFWAKTPDPWADNGSDD